MRWGTFGKLALAAFTVGGLATFAYLYPGRIQAALVQLWNELWPVGRELAVLLVVLWGLKIIVFGRGGGKK